MSHCSATVSWHRNGEVFTDNRYSRGHEWSFDRGVRFRASSSPQVVPRFSYPAGVDPEEAFVASLVGKPPDADLPVACGQKEIPGR